MIAWQALGITSKLTFGTASVPGNRLLLPWKPTAGMEVPVLKRID